nr:DUF3093 domain-containing protein [Nocardioides perillae]
MTVPLRWWVQGTMLVASLWLALVVAVPEPLAWAVTGVALALVALFLLAYGRAPVRVVTTPDGAELQAGRARIDVRHLGPATALDREATRRTAGVEADARAFLLLRPYLKRSVKVELRDPADPTPYWLVSTRHPQRLVAALEAARDGRRASDPR